MRKNKSIFCRAAISFCHTRYKFHSGGWRKLKLTVSVSTKLNRTHLVYGEEAIIFPHRRSDKDVADGKLISLSAVKIQWV
jgi:hypothetical protein